MLARIRFEGAQLRFEKKVVLEALPDIGDAVRVKPVGDWITLFGDEPVNGVVRGRMFIEADVPNVPDAYRLNDYPTMHVIIDVQQA